MLQMQASVIYYWKKNYNYYLRIFFEKNTNPHLFSNTANKKAINDKNYSLFIIKISTMRKNF